jgi:hypothetical protein
VEDAGDDPVDGNDSFHGQWTFSLVHKARPQIGLGLQPPTQK